MKHHTQSSAIRAAAEERAVTRAALQLGPGGGGRVVETASELRISATLAGLR